jgi:hypothetical protein
MWDRRQLIACLSTVSAVAVCGRQINAQPTGTAAPAMPGMAPGTMTRQACIESCWRTHGMCLETERYCLEKGGAHVMPTHLALLADCAEICQTTANSLLRRSSQHDAVRIACAQLCDACAQECEAFKGDEQILLCARTCRDCAQHCRDMSKLPI